MSGESHCVLPSLLPSEGERETSRAALVAVVAVVLRSDDNRTTNKNTDKVCACLRAIPCKHACILDEEVLSQAFNALVGGSGPHKQCLCNANTYLFNYK